jgi:hypothetical protein
MIKWFVEKIYHYSTALTSWSWTWLYGKRKTVAPKGLSKLVSMRVHYYKSLISFDKYDNIVEQILNEKRKQSKVKKENEDYLKELKDKL